MYIPFLQPGYVGISIGDSSLNAVYIDEDGDPCFFPVSQEDAEIIEAWSMGCAELPAHMPLEDRLALDPDYPVMDRAVGAYDWFSVYPR